MNHFRLSVLALLSLVVGLGCSPAPPRNEWTRDRDLFTRALTSFSQANALSQPPAGSTAFRMTDEQEAHFRQLLSDGLAAGDSVSDAYLDHLDPGMRHFFREYFMKGQHLYQKGMLARDVQLQAESDRLIATWYREYWQSHGPAITDKVLAE